MLLALKKNIVQHKCFITVSKRWGYNITPTSCFLLCNALFYLVIVAHKDIMTEFVKPAAGISLEAVNGFVGWASAGLGAIGAYHAITSSTTPSTVRKVLPKALAPPPSKRESNPFRPQQIVYRNLNPVKRIPSGRKKRGGKLPTIDRKRLQAAWRIMAKAYKQKQAKRKPRVGLVHLRSRNFAKYARGYRGRWLVRSWPK